MAKGGTAQRIASGWAVISEDVSTLQFKLAATGLSYGGQTRYEAWLDALEAFSGKPIMLIEFDKKPVPVTNLFRTHDLRAVQVCSPGGAALFDFTQEPTAESGKAHKVLWKLKLEPRRWLINRAYRSSHPLNGWLLELTGQPLVCFADQATV